METFYDDLEFLEGITAASVEASRVYPGEQIGPFPANTLDMVLIRPGGKACYPAVWTQDFSMALLSGFVTPEEALTHLRLIASVQHGATERRLMGDVVIPPYAIPDHILFDGSPIFFPGTYSPNDDQGGEQWGLRPPVNNHFDFILIADYILKQGTPPNFLFEIVNGASLIQRLRWAFEEPEYDSETELITIAEESRAVGFIFCDSIYMTGKHLFASLLRRRAALQLAEMEHLVGEPARAQELERIAKVIASHIGRLFRDPARLGGWLMAATEIGKQADVWGTIFAVYSGVLQGQDRTEAIMEIIRAIDEGTILYQGAVRHVPTSRDASPTSAWERTHTPYNRYQNGAYWHTPTGWLVAILLPIRPILAKQIFHEMVESLRAEDFRKGGDYNGPWECIGPDIAALNNPLFLASVALPYAVLKEVVGK